MTLRSLPLQSLPASSKTGPTEKRDKLKDANTIQKIDGWRALIFARLVEVESP